MLLYHFPLNTQESIENFTNKGFGNVNDILLTGSFVAANQGKISQKALYNYVDNAYNPIEIPLPQNGWSVAFRVKVDGTPTEDWSAIFQLFSNLTTAGFSGLLFHNGGFQFSATNIFNVDSEWHDIVVTQTKNNNILLFHNGIFSAVYNTNVNVFAIGLFGRYYNRHNSAKAFYQDIRIYDYALSQAEINEYSRAMVVHYPLQGNELNTSVLKDVSGFGNDATLIENVDYIDSARYSKALHKGGIGENRSGFFANNAFFTPNKYTISFWTKKDDSINSNYAIARFVCTLGYGYAGDRVYYDNSTKQLYWGIYNADNQWLVITSDAIKSEQTQWQFYTLTYDGTDVKLYRNGILCSIRSSYAMLSNYLSKYRIGIIYGSAFSDFRIYATALSAEDIKNLYNSPIAISNQHQSMAFEFVEGNDGFSSKKNGIVQHNELIEGSADGCYQDKLITNELIEN